MNMRSLASKLAVYFSIAALATPAFSQSFEAWEAKAQKAQKQGDEQVAAEYWTNALRVWEAKDGKSRRAKALSERAALREKAGEPDGALADLSAAIALDKKSAGLFDRRGQLLLAQGKVSEAISDFYSATKLSLGYGPAFYHRAQAYEKQGDAAFAAEDFRTACRLGVKDACARVKKDKEAAPKSKAAAPPAKKPPEPSAPARQEQAAPAAPAPPPAAAGPAQKAEPSPKPVEKAAPAKPDMRRCAAAIRACSDQGKAIDVCVGEIKTCEASPGKGCCPEACVRQFRRESTPDRSDAELFRQIFKRGAACAAGRAPVNP